MRDEEGAMKKYTAIFLAGLVVLLGSWGLVYEPYLKAQDAVARSCGSGKYAQAMGLIQEHRDTWAWFVMDNFVLLQRFRLRFLYNEGVVSAMLGDAAASEAAFQESALSTEKEIAASSLYNLALLSIQKGQIEIARSLLSKALSFSPWDIQSKANLELAIRRLRTEGLEQMEPEGEERPVHSEQWHDMPSIDGPGAPGGGRSYL